MINSVRKGFSALFLKREGLLNLKFLEPEVLRKRSFFENKIGCSGTIGGFKGINSDHHPCRRFEDTDDVPKITTLIILIMMKIAHSVIFLLFVSLFSCNSPQEGAALNSVPQDEPFLQDYSIKYYFDGQVNPKKVYEDRNGTTQVLTGEGLYRPDAGAFLYPGELIPDRTYLPMADKKLSGMGMYQHQFLYLDDEAVFGNAWAGSLFINHQLSQANLVATGHNFDFLISDGQLLAYLSDSKSLWKGSLDSEEILEIKYHSSPKAFLILTQKALYQFSVEDLTVEEVFSGDGLTSFDVLEDGRKIGIGTQDGYLELDGKSFKQLGEINKKLPWPHITVVKEIHGDVWIGSEKGAYMLREDGGFNYYYGERWLPGEQVVDIAAGEGNSVLVLTDAGLAKIVFEHMTLYDKALFYEKQVRHRHIRYGFNSSLVAMERGNVNSGRLGDSDNDGLWTAMYLGGQAFRYAVEPSEEALQNIRESLTAMERLFAVNPVPGFPARSYARSGYIDRLSDPERWQHAEDPEWDWKATTSSDEAIGHIFAYGVVAELVDDEKMKDMAITLIDTLMQHIIDNDWYLVDYDGKPTTWGRWNPEYVNGFPSEVGDRKLNSSNILAMLQTAYHFTQKEIYKEKAYELINDHGYLDNLMVPMARIGQAPDGADDWASMLSESWNHSDDEMYFLGYWGLYRYAFDDSLKAKYKESILDHWEAERPEKEGAWNIFTAMVSDDYDREEALWYLREYPLDLIHWTMNNSHRQDIELLEPNFRRQSTKEVLPPDELRISRHNANRFVLDGGRDGTQELSAGDIWLLPYWMGRYLGVIGEAESHR